MDAEEPDWLTEVVAMVEDSWDLSDCPPNIETGDGFNASPPPNKVLFDVTVPAD